MAAVAAHEAFIPITKKRPSVRTISPSAVCSRQPRRVDFLQFAVRNGLSVHRDSHSLATRIRSPGMPTTRLKTGVRPLGQEPSIT